MKIAISGSTGLIGRALTAHLRAGGHEIIVLVRSENQAIDSNHCLWQPDSGIGQPEKLNRLDAVVHLAGRGIADHRWSKREKDLIRASRVDATQRLCHDLAKLPHPPKTFLSASAVGIYGNRGDEPVSESRPSARDFLAGLVRDWEAASERLTARGIRVVHARFGIVLSPDGGALAKMLPLFRWGLGSKLGSGRQYWSWISLDDAVRALELLLTHEECRGPFNIVAPHPVSNAEFTRTLARILHRTRFLPVPALPLRWILGEFADAALLASCRAVPQRLIGAGFHFTAPTLAEALSVLVKR